MKTQTLWLTALWLAGTVAAWAQGNQGRPPTPEQVFQQFDRNHDGKLSRQEAPPPLQRDFDRFDLNHDGYVTIQEMKQAGPGGQRGGNQQRPGQPGGLQGPGQQGQDPGGLPSAQGLTLATSQSSPGYTLFAPMQDTKTYLVDRGGKPVATWASQYRPGLSVYLRPNGNLLRTGVARQEQLSAGKPPTIQGGVIQELAPTGEVIWEVRLDSDTVQAHHDIQPLPNGNVIALVKVLKSSSELHAAGGDPRVHRAGQVWVEELLELRPKGRDGYDVVWQWRSWDHLVQDHDRQRPNYGTPAEHPERIDLNFSPHGQEDLFHGNAVDYCPSRDLLVLSLRATSELWVIDHSTTAAEAASSQGGTYGRGGDLLYRFGNPAARGGRGAQTFVGQHDAAFVGDPLDGGTFTVFNNGTERSDVLEVRPDDFSRQTATTGQVVWRYDGGDEPFAASHISGAQRLANGNTLVCVGTDGHLLEVTPAGETVWDYTVPGSFERPAHGQGGGRPQGNRQQGRGGLTFAQSAASPSQSGRRPLQGGQRPSQGQRGDRNGPGGRGGQGPPPVRATEIFRATRYAPDYPGLKPYLQTPQVNLPRDLSYAIVDTGQSRCFGAEGGIISPPTRGEELFGQDAQYQGYGPSYTDHGDGTVTDDITGLMWEQSPDLVGHTKYQQALDGAGRLRTGGYRDWRLPTVKELYSLMDFGGGASQPFPRPYLEAAVFDFRFGAGTDGERRIDAQYWTSTRYLGTTMNNNPTAFGVNFADGRIKGYPINQFDHGRFVRHVRGNPDYGKNDFVDNGDNTITDRATGLMWSKYDSATGLDWPTALAAAADCNVGGYTDWRLPNAKELQSIVDYDRAPEAQDPAQRGPAIDPIFELTDPKSYGWTSTTHLDGPPDRVGCNAVYVCFGQSLGNLFGQGFIDVHGAGAQRSDPKTGDPSDYTEGHGPQGDDIRILNYVRVVRDVR